MAELQQDLPLPDPARLNGHRRAIGPRTAVPQRFRYLVHDDGVGFGFTNRADASAYAARISAAALPVKFHDRGRFR